MLDQSKGKLLAIAVKSTEDGNMHLLEEAEVTTASGIANDPKGKKPSRQVTVVSAESWAAVCKELGKDVPWTLRKANLLIDGISLPESKGKTLTVGEVEMQITFETTPCHVMDEGEEGLKNALIPDWRGGVLCKVIKEGNIKCGDLVTLN